MFDFLADVLSFFYDLWPSFGGAIILFTLAIMAVLTPLSIKSTRSMIKMQRVQPELKKLQQKHKGDREALNREMMSFYQENNINPFSSCLPLLLQMPVFIVLYQVLIGLTRRGDDGRFNPKYLEDDTGALATALRGASEMMSFGMDLSQSALSELQNEGVLVALPYVILVALVAGSAYVQQRQIAGRNPAAAANPQQQMITKIMPFIFIPISVSIPAGVVIYFVVSNLVRIGQQGLVTRLEFGGSDGGGRDGVREAKVVKEGKGGPDAKGIEKKGTGTVTDEPSPSKRAAGKPAARGPGSPPARKPVRSPASPPGGNGARTANGAASSRPRNRKRKRK